jgi:hypothetical protein
MCINEDPMHRYATIGDVATDLQHYLTHRPVHAARPSFVRRVTLWGRRNPLYGILLSLFILGSVTWGIQFSIDYTQQLQARREIRQLSIPSHYNPATTNEQDLRRTLDTAERILGRYPDDPEIVAKTLSLYDDYINLHRQGKRNMYIAFRETDRIISTLGILYWNPNIPNSVKERLIELQLMRLETPSGWHNIDDAKWLKEKIEVELNHYDGPQREAFLRRLNALATPPTNSKDSDSPRFNRPNNPRKNTSEGPRSNRPVPRSPGHNYRQ